MESIEFVNRKSERGFTLVELAIVMIIIGLLIGGILKGQELIANARVTATVAQVKGIDAATTTFQDKYDGMPGDLRAADTRLPALCDDGTSTCTAGDGNGRVDTTNPGDVPTGENQQFFQHLSAADLVSDLKLSTGNFNGGYYPVSKIGGAWAAAYAPGTAALTDSLGPVAQTRAGHYLTLATNANAAIDSATITPTQAFRIDNKLDDGQPGSGSVFGTGTDCGTITDYAEATGSAVCGLYVRFHQ